MPKDIYLGDKIIKKHKEMDTVRQDGGHLWKEAGGCDRDGVHGNTSSGASKALSLDLIIH